LCTIPSINNFSPAKLRAGNGEILTITGTNFGTQRGVVQFRNADVGFGYIAGCDSVDIVSWTNTQIQIKVPSVFLDTVKYKGTPGSGKFIVKHRTGGIDSSDTNLDIEYALNNFFDPIYFRKTKCLYANIDCRNGMFFKMGNNLVGKTAQIAAIDSAFRYWSNHLKIIVDWERDINGNIITSNVYNKLDFIYVIYNTYYTNNSLMETVRGYSIIPNSTTTQISISGADIGIDSTKNWHFTIGDNKPAGKFDFFSTILHEIGHALGLDHVIDPNQELMHYSQGSEYKSVAQRTTLNTGRGTAKLGTTNIKTASRAITWLNSSIKTIREFTQAPPITTTCEGNNATIEVLISTTPTSTPAITYKWQKLNGSAFQDLTTGSPYTGISSKKLTITASPIALNGSKYRCKVSFDGCTYYSQPSILNINAKPTITTQPVNTSVITGNNTSFTVVSPTAITYQWRVNSGAAPNAYTNVSGASYANATSAVLGINNTPTTLNNRKYQCVVTNNLGCNRISNNATLTVLPARINPNKVINNDDKVNIFPNPTSAILNIKIEVDYFANETIQYGIYDLSGKQIMWSNLINSQINTQSLANGQYVLMLSDGVNQTAKSFVVNR
jgi:hypothetical protein